MNLTDEQLVKRILECENRADCMDDETCLHMAEDVMREVMSRVKKNIVLIKDKLESKGYEFKYPDKAHAFPLDRISERIQAVESNGFFLPLSLKTWFTVVGSVNFMGSHPDWARPSYVYNPNQFDGEPWYTDPLVIEDALLEDAFTNWTDKKGFMAGVNIVQPRIPVSPDASHKSNVSGGASYEIFFAAPAIDSLLHNEPHGRNFVEYLRIACSWGGFPGVRKIDEFPKNFIRDLTSALVPFEFRNLAIGQGKPMKGVGAEPGAESDFGRTRRASGQTRSTYCRRSQRLPGSGVTGFVRPGGPGAPGVEPGVRRRSGLAQVSARLRAERQLGGLIADEGVD